MTIGLLSLCPCITSLKFLSCSPCTVPPFELYSGGVVVLIIASAIFEHICLSSPLLWRIPGPWLIQPRGIEVSFLYRNAGWALQAGICREALAFNHYTRKWGFGIKAIFIVRPSTSTDHNRGFGPGVGSFEVRIADFESCPQLPFRQKASRCLGPKPQQNLVCHPWGLSVDAGACFWTRGCEDNLVHLCIRGGFLGRKICLLLQLCAAFNLWKTAIWIKCCCFLVEGSIFVLKEFHICLVCSWYLRDGLFESLRGKGATLSHWKVRLVPFWWPAKHMALIRVSKQKDFYQTLVSLGSGLWVPVSVPPSGSFLKLSWCDSDDDTNSIWLMMPI